MTRRRVRYHRLARTARFRWWRPLVELALTVGLGLAMAIALLVLLSRWIDGLGGIGGLVLLAASLVPFLPAALLAARVVGRDPGTLSSVRGRLRWHWLGRCTGAALLVMAIGLVLYGAARLLGIVVIDHELPGWPGLAAFLLPLLVVLLVIPLQAAAEEYVFRGTLIQAIGAWVASPWVAIAISSLAFAAAHGLGGPGFVALVGFGVLAGWLTIRTGGLEAAIALHVVNNVVMFAAVAAGGGTSTWVSELNVGITWQATLLDLAGMALYALIVVRMSARRAIASAARLVPA
jgi:uncharacterized protein